MTKTTFFVMSTIAASATIAGCNNTENPVVKKDARQTAFNLATAKKEIAGVSKQFMDLLAKGDSVGIANLYTTDAKLMFTGTPATIGRAAIQSVFAGIINSGVTKVELKTIDVYGTEDLLVEEGAITIYVKDLVVAEEKSIILWKKEEGKWKVFRDIANSNKAN
jgi:uncharacterized protein (TIGR02246 family)